MTHAPAEANRLGRPASSPGLLLPLWQTFEFAGRLLEARRGRREVLRLARNNDALLADIGIARSDVELALKQPWHADPSRALAMGVNCRKATSRWARERQGSSDKV